MTVQYLVDFPIPRPWAKLRRRCQQGKPYCRERCACEIAAHLSLIGHSADVAAVLGQLLRLPTVRARLARLAARELSEQDIARLVAFGALHDLGKVNHGFLNQALPAGASGPRGGHMAPLAALWHGSPADPEWRRVRSHLAALSDLGEVERWFPAEHRRDYLLPLLAHHGALPAAGLRASADLWQPVPDYDPIGAIGDLLAAIRGWLPAAFAAGAPLPWTARLAQAFAGLLMLADWLGSDEARFGYGGGEPDGPARFAWSLVQAAQAMGALGLDPSSRRTAVLRLGWRFVELFPELAEQGHLPRPAQAEMLALPPARAEGRIIVLEAETGSGKTEAAVAHFLDLLRQGLVDGLYFALPTRAAAVQIQRRVDALLRRSLGEAAPPVGLAVPGYRRVGEMELLPDESGRWPDAPGETLHDRFWAVERPKRYLAGAAMVGTVDQALAGALRVRHAQLRSAALLRLLLVVDEVHASDVYMTELLRRLLDQHVAAGGHVLLMSATLGAGARTRLTSSASDRSEPPCQAQAAALPYPSLQLDAGWPQSFADKAGPNRPPVQVELRQDWQDLPALIALLGQTAEQGARVLVLRNTVRDALATQQALEAAGVPTLRCQGIPALHHARFAAEDRRLLDEALETALGKAAERGSGLVAVTTQTAEMALDLDADLLVTDLCPADVLLQRLGRLHRHPRTRLPAFARARVVVLAPEKQELGATLRPNGEVRGGLLGLGRIYPDLLGILATRCMLAELGEVRVPEHCRRLVEAATHPEALARLGQRLGGAWGKHHQTIWGQSSAARGQARSAAIAWCEPIQPLPKELATPLKTRLGLDDREVELPADVTGPFGHRITRLRVPGWMAEGVPAAAMPTGFSLAVDELTFELGDRRFRYDRLGLRPAE